MTDRQSLWSWRRLRAVARKEWTHLRRDRQSLGVILLLPIVTLILYGYAINFDLKHIPLGILDRDHTPRSRALREALQGNEYLKYVGDVSGEAQVERLFNHGTVRAVIVIPQGFDSDLSAGRRAELQAIYDGSDSTTAGVAIAYADAQIGDFLAKQGASAALKRAPRAMRKQPNITIAPRILYNPELNSTNYIVPGLLVLILSITAALLTSTTVAREREVGTLEGLVVSPVQARELMVGKLIPYVCAGMVDVTLLIVFGYVLFGVFPVGSLALLMSGMLIFLAGVMGLGLLISARAPSQAFALQLGFLATLLPTLLLSGFAYPRQSMPALLYDFTALLPSTQFLIFVREIYLKGSGISQLWPQVAWLAITTVVFLRGASTRFVKRLD
ncbi:MAG TPA: ABC transporter permease [Armatimonadota bacterium]|jgi:ABC-2 type transport system permease protein